MAEKKREPADATSDDAVYAARAAFYGLDVKDAPKEPLLVDEGECIRLTPKANGSGRFDDRLRQIPVQSVRDLKRLIGTPDEVVRSHGCRCVDVPGESVPPNFKSLADLDGEQHRALYAASHAYLYGDSARVSHFEAALDVAYASDKRRFIGVLFLNDLIVERNSTVMLGGSANVALFRRIVIKRNGKLRLEKTIKIDCVSIEGEGLLSAQVFPRDIVTAATRGNEP